MAKIWRQENKEENYFATARTYAGGRLAEEASCKRRNSSYGLARVWKFKFIVGAEVRRLRLEGFSARSEPPDAGSYNFKTRSYAAAASSIMALIWVSTSWATGKSPGTENRASISVGSMVASFTELFSS